MPEQMKMLKHKTTGAVHGWTPSLALDPNMVEADEGDLEKFRNTRRERFIARTEGNLNDDNVAEIRETIMADGERNSSPERQTEYAIAQELAIVEGKVPSQRMLERETAGVFVEKDQEIRGDKRSQPPPEPLVEDPEALTRDARRAEERPSQPTLNRPQGALPQGQTRRERTASPGQGQPAPRPPENREQSRPTPPRPTPPRTT
jgi:hypothetical protein